jgi:hypothetical protein
MQDDTHKPSLESRVLALRSAIERSLAEKADPLELSQRHQEAMDDLKADLQRLGQPDPTTGLLVGLLDTFLAWHKAALPVAKGQASAVSTKKGGSKSWEPPSGYPAEPPSEEDIASLDEEDLGAV